MKSSKWVISKIVLIAFLMMATYVISIAQTNPFMLTGESWLSLPKEEQSQVIDKLMYRYTNLGIRFSRQANFYNSEMQRYLKQNPFDAQDGLSNNFLAMIYEVEPKARTEIDKLWSAWKSF